jgi:hypothetical protein
MRKPKRPNQIIATQKADVIRVVENHVEYFTVNATGEAGISVSGSGRFNGVTHQAITKILQKVENSVATERLPYSLKPIVGKPLTLTTQLTYKNSSVLNDNTCAALTEYYAFDAPNRDRNPRPYNPGYSEEEYPQRAKAAKIRGSRMAIMRFVAIAP